MAVDDFLFVELVGDRTLTRNLDRMPDTVRAILVDKVTEWTHRMANAVRANIATRLSQKSGELLNAVQEQVLTEGGKVEGRVYIAGVAHARAQEKGAVIPPHIIRPRQAKVLAFFGATGEKVFATRVIHPGGQIKPQYFMKDAYRDIGPEISRGIKKAIVDGVRQNMRRSS